MTHAGEGLRQALNQFEKAFGLQVDQAIFPTSAGLIPKLTQERTAGIYSFDAMVFSATSPMPLIPQGIFDPLMPVLIRPDITGDEYWHGGFETGFLDNEKRFTYLFLADVGSAFWINTDQVKEGELKSIRDLLNPKWTGRLLLADTSSGYTSNTMWLARRTVGDEFVRGLLVDQKPVFQRDQRFIMDQMVRGNYPIANGFAAGHLKQYLDQGLGKNLKQVVFPETQYESSEGQLWLVNRAPHPNAAKLFVNWLLTKEGGTAWSEGNGQNSRRTDVPPRDPEMLPTVGPNYLFTKRESAMEDKQASLKLLESLVR